MNWLQLSAVTVVVLGLPARSLANLDPPAAPTTSELAPFVGEHSSESYLVTDRWSACNLRFDRAKQGLVGEYVLCEEYLLQSSGALETVSFVQTVDSYVIELAAYRAEIIDQAGGVRTIEAKDLRWAEVTQRRSGIVVVDGKYRLAMVPGLRVGDRVRHITRYNLKGIHGIPSMQLGGGATPVFRAAAEIRVPRNYELESKLLGVRELMAAARQQSIESDSQRGTLWQLADADLDSALCKVDHGSLRVVAQIVRTDSEQTRSMAVGDSWQLVGQAYLDRLGKRTFESNRSMRQLAERTVDGSSSTAEAIDRIYRLVQNSCRYLGLYEKLGGILPAAASEVHKSGFGDCKGLGSFLIAMLRSIGVAAYPVLVATSDSGGILTELPNMTQFNHFIVWVDDDAGGLWLDATADYTPAGRIHPWAARYPALVLQPGAIRLENIPRTAWDPGVTTTVVRGSVDATGQLSASLEVRVDGSNSADLRNSFAGIAAAELPDRGSARFVKSGLGLDVLAPSVEGIDDWSAPLRFSAQLQSTTPLPRAGSTLLLPRLLIGSSPGLRELPTCSYEFSLRTVPEQQESWEIQLPGEFRLVPEEAEYCVEVAGLSWCRRTWIEGRTLYLTRQIRLTVDSLSGEALGAFALATQNAKRAESGYFRLLPVE